ncbi:MAG: carbon-nitrogen hydrolase [Ignavibacteriales bacterium]|nr:MAG: carbon-nitrogen hydrolase [Ignavibacteriales bacterium]
MSSKKNNRKQNSIPVALIQIALSKNPDSNLKKAIDWIIKSAKTGAKVICLPELYRSQYFCQKEDIKYFDLAETIPGPSTVEIGKIAKKLKVVVIVPIFEKRAAGLYHNSLVIINSDGNVTGLYRKMHIPDDPAFYEKFYFTPGDLGYKSFKTEYGNVGTLICWDQWYPEGARLTALQGSDIIFYPTAIGWHPHEKAEHGKAQFESWQTIQRSHAIANGVFVAAVNRVGLEKENPSSPGLEFWGSSFIADPQGIIIAQASADKEEIVFADIDLNRIEYIRRNWPFLRDRRIETYGQIKERFIDQKKS